jgi:UDPglucose 6-dehydrogenase
VSNETLSISVVGLGKLGAPLAACFAAKGFQVIGVDLNLPRIQAINRSQALEFEPGLQEFLIAGKERLTATLDIEAAVLASSMTFIVVPTPSAPDGGFSLRHVLPICDAIGRALRTKVGFHLVVLTSTVMAGATGGAVRSSLEQSGRKLCGRDFGLCYSPAFVALGSVIRDFLNPDFLLIGESDPHSGEMLALIYKQICENNPPVARMNFINAELTKLAINSFVTAKITFANMLARMCERLPEADVDVVTWGLGLDTRIGRKYLTGAIGYGGPCFPRDNMALAALARQTRVPAALTDATDRTNRQGVRWLAALVRSKMRDGGTVGILGLAYKPNTNVIEESQGVLLAETLISEGVPVVAYDPAAMNNARQVLNGPIRFADSLEACVQQADVLLITTPWDAFRKLLPEVLRVRTTALVLIDCWRILDREGVGAPIDYIALGIGPKTASLLTQAGT